MKTKILLSLVLIVAVVLTLQPVYACRWRRFDLNHDGKVDILDVTIVANAYGSRKGQPSYKARIDFNHDKVINIFDVVMIARYYGSDNKRETNIFLSVLLYGLYS